MVMHLSRCLPMGVTLTKLAWAKLKNLIIINIVSGDINMNRPQRLVLEATSQISRGDGKNTADMWKC